MISGPLFRLRWLEPRQGKLRHRTKQVGIDLVLMPRKPSRRGTADQHALVAVGPSASPRLRAVSKVLPGRTVTMDRVPRRV
ncbi:hypothetical protein EAH80_21210 [Mycobacterium hodleri]|uniref:Uncharacterized protein n=1 Tax=Mycolicibacterium hodleri TaxID=49897 RepID=A0A502E4K3_9MYCO|nr:hypothetical protein EAH80_21210 [Mycolicibacterium hodleri]